MEPEGLFSLENGKRGEGRGKPQYRFPGMGGHGGVWGNFSSFRGNWVAKKWGALRDWVFDEGFYAMKDKMITC